jgi:serine phosphatase RsbU (regulator of sigma subunit)
MGIKSFILTLLISLTAICSFAQNLPPQKQTEVDQYNEMVTKFKSEGNQSETANYLNKIAYIYWENNCSKDAINYFNQSLEINQAIGNNNAIKTIYLNLGMIYTDINQYDKALGSYQKSLQISRNTKKNAEIASCLINIASVQTSLKKYNDAITSLEEAMNLSKELNNEKLLRNCYGKLSENYRYLGNAQKSAEYSELYTTFDKYVQNQEFKKLQQQKDSQLNQLYSKTNQIEAEKILTESQLKLTVSSLKEFKNLSLEQKKQIYTLNLENQLKDLKNKENEIKLRQTRFLIFSIIGFAILLGIVALISYRAYKQKKRTNVVLESQNKEILEHKDKIDRQNQKITDSIAYAQRIQQSFLSSEESLQKHIQDSFILFHPRDIVSGDFYWYIETGKSSLFSKYNNLEVVDEDKFTIAAVDCTGHGVPGAFMSMIAYTQLNAIAFRGITKADEILNELHKGIRVALRQYKNDNRDGMDMAICVYNKEHKTLDFSGAKNPLVYIKNNELTVIKGDRYPIGGIQLESERTFSKHTVKVDQAISFYIFSDGYIDQFGGEEGDKYGLKQLSELLLQVSNESMPRQKEILEETLHQWQGNNYAQVDDILLIGFKIKP